MRAYEFKHTVGLEETNLVGNVYFLNHLRWQGQCREMFLRQHAPEILADLCHGLALITMKCSCEYLSELSAFDEIVIRMRLSNLTQSRVSMHFEYWKLSVGKEELIARGEQHIACMRREGAALVPTPVPAPLRKALEHYA